MDSLIDNNTILTQTVGSLQAQLGVQAGAATPQSDSSAATSRSASRKRGQTHVRREREPTSKSKTPVSRSTESKKAKKPAKEDSQPSKKTPQQCIACGKFDPSRNIRKHFKEHCRKYQGVKWILAKKPQDSLTEDGHSMLPDPEVILKWKKVNWDWLGLVRPEKHMDSDDEEVDSSSDSSDGDWDIAIRQPDGTVLLNPVSLPDGRMTSLNAGLIRVYSQPRAQPESQEEHQESQEEHQESQEEQQEPQEEHQESQEQDTEYHQDEGRQESESAMPM